MTRGILIAGNESSLFSAMCDEAGKRVTNYAAACITQLPNEFPAGRPGAKNLEWNPSNPISARALILEAERTLEHIDEAILVCVPPAYRRLPGLISPAEIDRFVDYNIKGWFFLVRELALLFKNRRNLQAGPGSPAFAGSAGSLVFALQETNARSDSDIAGPSAAASFRSFGQSILFAREKQPWTAMGFSLPEPGEESAFAVHVFKAMEDGGRNAGKWHRFGKFNVFGR